MAQKCEDLTGFIGKANWIWKSFTKDERVVSNL
jgi:hypothetical protein